MHQNAFGGRAPPEPAGELQRSPRPSGRSQGEGKGGRDKKGRDEGGEEYGQSRKGGGEEGKGECKGDCIHLLRGDRRPCSNFIVMDQCIDMMV